MIAGIFRWIDANILELGRELRLSFLPPLMVYVAYGISGLTGIVGTFFVKEYLGLSAAFLAALGFWVGIPWALKMPLGHLVDLMWRWKSWLVFLGAGLIASSLLIMVGLLTDRAAMTAVMPAEAWFVLAAPKGTPREIILTLNEHFRKAMTVPDTIRRFQAEGLDVVGSTPEQAAATMASELKKYAVLIRERGMKAN